MKATPFQHEWIEIARTLGLRIQLSFELALFSKRLIAPVLLEEYGGENGMLLVTDFEDVREVTEELDKLGYSFSCMIEPLIELNPSEADEEYWNSVNDMLRDWGRNC